MRNIMQLWFANGQLYVSRKSWYRWGRGQLELSTKNAEVYRDLVCTAFEYLHVILKQGIYGHIIFASIWTISELVSALTSSEIVELGKEDKNKGDI